MATEYVVRDTAGSVRNGTFPQGDPASVYVSFSRDVSLNLNSSDVASYLRNGDNLLVTLQDGQVLVLDGYFQESATGPKNLFLGDDGQLVEVFLGDALEGPITAEYVPLDITGKWSAYDDLVFLDLERIEPVVAPLAAPVIGGLGPVLAGGAAAAAALLGGGGADADAPPIVPTVDEPESTQVIGGTLGGAPIVSGTGEPGSTVDVTVGEQTVSTTVGDDGIWRAEFDPDNLPADGVTRATVHVVAPDGGTHDLDGPTMDIDTTPPAVAVTDGAESTGDLVNAV